MIALAAATRACAGAFLSPAMLSRTSRGSTARRRFGFAATGFGFAALGSGLLLRFVMSTRFLARAWSANVPMHILLPLPRDSRHQPTADPPILSIVAVNDMIPLLALHVALSGA